MSGKPATNAEIQNVVAVYRHNLELNPSQTAAKLGVSQPPPQCFKSTDILDVGGLTWK